VTVDKCWEGLMLIMFVCLFVCLFVLVCVANNLCKCVCFKAAWKFSCRLISKFGKFCDSHFVWACNILSSCITHELHSFITHI
jgi:hypothetical protein